MKTIKNLLFTLNSLMLLTIILKRLAVPGSGMFFVLVISSLIFLYLVQATYMAGVLKENTKLKWSAIFVSVGMTYVCLNILFTIQFWPLPAFFNHLFNVLFGFIFLLVVGLYAKRKFFTKEHYKILRQNIIIPFLFLLIPGILCIFPPKFTYELLHSKEYKQLHPYREKKEIMNSDTSLFRKDKTLNPSRVN